MTKQESKCANEEMVGPNDSCDEDKVGCCGSVPWLELRGPPKDGRLY